MYQAILFDLDGTLLPMDMNAFMNRYFSLLAEKAAPYGYEPEALVKGVWTGTKAMMQNDGTMSNCERFWKTFAGIFGDRAYMHIPVFDSFYKSEFHAVKETTSPDPDGAKRAVEAAKKCGRKVILATNPLFPEVGVETRLSWIGLGKGDFDYVTSYENSRYCKPNTAYYGDILKKAGLDAEQCLMVGNDVGEDVIPARKLGMDAYLVSGCAINKTGEKPDCREGTLAELPAFLLNN